MDPFIAVIIVTHNSSQFLAKNISALELQTHPAQQLIVVDSGSQNSSYLKQYEACAQVVYEKNIGFAAANNLGWKLVDPQAKYVLFLNPDAFLTPDFLKQATLHLEKREKCGILTGPLLGFDFINDLPTGKFDSTGVFSTWYGKWYDRGQGQPVSSDRYHLVEEVPAICGALMFCRKAALECIGEVWDASFFMYKEDIDLSLRMRKEGWKLVYDPQLIAYHGRGWQDRSQMPRLSRLYSARNELKLHWKARMWSHMPYSLAKYTAVKLLDI